MTNCYNPVPTRAWSRVQGICSFSAENVFSEDNQTYKGNILQYKANSATYTKKEKYARLAKGFSNQRNKFFATQSQTVSNPNIYGLLRTGYTTYTYNNETVGAPNNIAGPFATQSTNPFNCSSTDLLDGGSLIVGKYVNPCTNEIIREIPNSEIICAPASASNIPGNEVLCWNKKYKSYYPRNKRTYNNSANKFPTGYKGFVSAIHLTS